MRFHYAASTGLALFTSLSYGALVPAHVEKRATTTTPTPDPQCTNGPDTRACWKNGFSISTDFDEKFPTTGNTVTYNLELTNGTCNPDGNGARICLLVNNQYPGPLIKANWGDNLVINVKNSMQHNGTSMHWHGVRQYHSPGSDGVNGVTECPLAPGQSRTYSFQVTQFGTSWYHSHFSSQYGDGVVGPIVFEGPASANYDIDLGPYPVSDWYYQTAFQANAQTLINLQNQDPPPPANNILINGTNQNANGGGKYNQVTIQKGKKYRLRLINTSVDNNIRVSLDGHQLQVMTSDFIPVKPFLVDTLLMSIGQRYDVVVTANQTAGNYWFRANAANDCESANDFYGRAIWTYEGVAVATPSSTGYTEPTTCLEPPVLAPFWYQPVPSSSFAQQVQELGVNITKQVIVPGGDAVFVWALNGPSLNLEWEDPTLQYLMNGNESFPAVSRVLPTVSEGGWNYWLIQQLQVPPVPHPIHLHGHDFFVLGTGSGTFDASTADLNFDTPPRRDTVPVPAGGWLALAFVSNNPGTWLMHCHIAWHVSEGLAVQFLEAPSQITFPSKSAFESECAAWKKYYATAVYKKIDSGV